MKCSLFAADKIVYIEIRKSLQIAVGMNKRICQEHWKRSSIYKNELQSSISAAIGYKMKFLKDETLWGVVPFLP